MGRCGCADGCFDGWEVEGGEGVEGGVVGGCIGCCWGWCMSSTKKGVGFGWWAVGPGTVCMIGGVGGLRRALMVVRCRAGVPVGF